MSSEHVHVEQVGPVTVVSFPGEELSLTENLLADLTPVVLDAAHNASRLLLDLQGVKFFGSSFIELMFRCWNRVKNKPGGQFALCGLHQYCREVLEITNLTSVWPVYETRDEALSEMDSTAATHG